MAKRQFITTRAEEPKEGSLLIYRKGEWRPISKGELLSKHDKRISEAEERIAALEERASSLNERINKLAEIAKEAII